MHKTVLLFGDPLETSLHCSEKKLWSWHGRCVRGEVNNVPLPQLFPAFVQSNQHFQGDK